MRVLIYPVGPCGVWGLLYWGYIGIIGYILGVIWIIRHILGLYSV